MRHSKRMQTQNGFVTRFLLPAAIRILGRQVLGKDFLSLFVFQGVSQCYPVALSISEILTMMKCLVTHPLFVSPDCRFLSFLPSTLTCACVSTAIQKVKMVDSHNLESVIMFLASLLAADLVSIIFNQYLLQSL